MVTSMYNNAFKLQCASRLRAVGFVAEIWRTRFDMLFVFLPRFSIVVRGKI